MGPLVAVNRHEAVEALLLLVEVEGRGFCRFGFQHQMHALDPDA